jgi:hypothetical protein
MDKDFNINLNVTACTFGKMIQQFNEKHPSTSNISPFHKNTILGVTVSSHIPAVINDTLDQRRQNGKQTTTFGIIESFGNGGSN